MPSSMTSRNERGAESVRSKPPGSSQGTQASKKASTAQRGSDSLRGVMDTVLQAAVVGCVTAALKATTSTAKLFTKDRQDVTTGFDAPSVNTYGNTVPYQWQSIPDGSELPQCSLQEGGDDLIPGNLTLTTSMSQVPPKIDDRFFQDSKSCGSGYECFGSEHGVSDTCDAQDKATTALIGSEASVRPRCG